MACRHTGGCCCQHLLPKLWGRVPGPGRSSSQYGGPYMGRAGGPEEQWFNQSRCGTWHLGVARSLALGALGRGGRLLRTTKPLFIPRGLRREMPCRLGDQSKVNGISMYFKKFGSPKLLAALNIIKLWFALIAIGMLKTNLFV